MSAWIVSQWADLAFFVATPVLIIPAIFLLHRRFPADDIGMFVAAFGATGHHLPGILRAYGDRDLFRRFRTRFILAPLFLFTVCAVFAQLDLQSLGVLVLLWGVWHGAMQVYGFLRIYDAKVRSVASWTARWDLWMCWSWFGAGILASPDRLGDLLQTLYKAGCPLLPVRAFPEPQADNLEAGAKRNFQILSPLDFLAPRLPKKGALSTFRPKALILSATMAGTPTSQGEYARRRKKRQRH